jgi:hypothetical protein
MSPDKNERSRKNEKLGLPPGLPPLETFAIKHQTDNEGRLLKEDRALAEDQAAVVAAGVSMDQIQCPYHDSPSRFQHDHPLNKGALQQYAAHKEEVWASLAYIRDLYQRNNPYTAPTIDQAIELGAIASSIPSYLFNRSRAPLAPQGELPGFIAAMYKTINGIEGGLLLMRDQMNPKAHISAHAIVDFVEHNEDQPLVGRANVCAAPPNQIQTTVEAMLDGKHVAPELRNRLAEYIPPDESKQLLRYAQQHRKVNVGISVFSEESTTIIHYMQMKAAQLVQSGISRGQFFNQMEIPYLAYAHREREFLQLLEQAEPGMNASLGRGRSTRQTTSADLDTEFVSTPRTILQTFAAATFAR